MIAGRELVVEVVGRLYDQGVIVDDEMAAMILMAMGDVVREAIRHHEVVEIPGIGLSGMSGDVNAEIEAHTRAAKAHQAAREAQAKRRDRKRKRQGRKVGGKTITPRKTPGKSARKERLAAAKNRAVKRQGIMPRNRKALA